MAARGQHISTKYLYPSFFEILEHEEQHNFILLALHFHEFLTFTAVISDRKASSCSTIIVDEVNGFDHQISEQRVDFLTYFS